MNNEQYQQAALDKLDKILDKLDRISVNNFHGNMMLTFSIFSAAYPEKSIDEVNQLVYKVFSILMKKYPETVQKRLGFADLLTQDFLRKSSDS